MTYAPATLLELRQYLAPRTGLSAGNLGIVGDTAHAQRGTSYHLGRDQLTATAYSIQTLRDRNGLTNAASAMDIGNHPDLRRLSKDLVAACRVNAPGTVDIREVIYSPDGDAVFRWDRERGYATNALRMPSTALNNTHRWHTHISWYRDSEKRDKVGVFRPLYSDTQGDDVPPIEVTPEGTIRAYIIRVTAQTGTYGPAQGQRGSIGPKADGSPWVGNGLGVYLITGLGDKRAFLIGQSREYVLEDAVQATLNERDTATAPADTPHTVVLTVDGQTKYSETLP